MYFYVQMNERYNFFQSSELLLLLIIIQLSRDQ